METYTHSETADCNTVNKIESNSRSEKAVFPVILSVLIFFLFPLLLIIKPLYDYRLTGSLSFDDIIAWPNIEEALILSAMVYLVVVPVFLLASRQDSASSELEE